MAFDSAVCAAMPSLRRWIIVVRPHGNPDDVHILDQGFLLRGNALKWIRKHAPHLGAGTLEAARIRRS